MKELLELRNKIKRKKPKFIRQDAHKKARLGKKWKRPRGLNSKIRQCKRGKQKGVSTGYGSPKPVKGLTSGGLMPLMVKSMVDMGKINKEKEVAIISSTLGDKKRIDIIKKAKEQGINIINVGDIDDHIKRIEERLKLRKELRNKKVKVKKEKQKEKKTVEKEDLAAKIDEEDKKEQEKKKKDKLLTKRDIK